MTWTRRELLQAAAGTTAVLASRRAAAANDAASGTRAVRLARTDSNFEREPLLRPFGFKGGYMSEIWQTAVRL